MYTMSTFARITCSTTAVSKNRNDTAYAVLSLFITVLSINANMIMAREKSMKSPKCTLQ